MSDTFDDDRGGISRANWEDLSVFAAVVRAGSFRKAADDRGVSQAMISRRVENLEKRLNATLFVRSPSGVTLTDAGRRAADQVLTMERAARRLESETTDVDKRIAGRVTIAAGEALALYFLAPELPRLQMLTPQLNVAMLTAQFAPDPSSGDCDVALQYHETRSMDCVARRLGRVHYCAYASAEYLEAHGSPASVLDGVNHRLVSHTGYINQIKTWAEKTPELHRILDYVIETDSTSVVHQAVINGGGVAVLPTYASAVDDRLRILELQPLAHIDFWITYPSNSRSVGRIKHVVDWIRNVFDPAKNPWFRDEFVHPRDFGGARTPGYVGGNGDHLAPRS